MQNVRNFVIIAHIDSGKSTLADRLLELTGTVEKRKMHEQFLDQMELERERGITIKLAPVQMKYVSSKLDRGLNADFTQTDAEKEFLYEDLTYKIRGSLFKIRRNLGLGHKEKVYHSALEVELARADLGFESKKNLSIIYEGENIGTYQPDFIVEDRVIIELKALPEVGRPQVEQLWSYLKGSNYRLALLVNFGSKDLEIKRVIYDSARDFRLQRFSALNQRVSAGVSNQVEYVLNLIDTPGHVDFTYEVSRSLAAVEGAVLLVDGVKGVQAQTLANLRLAQEQNLTIIPVINKIDLKNTRVAEIEEEMVSLLGVKREEIIKVSAKEGTNVQTVLERIISDVPPPARSAYESFRALIFDSRFDPYKGVIAYVRIFDGEIKKGEKIKLFASGAKGEAIEVGYFGPHFVSQEKLSAGEIGYIATGIKEPGLVRVGDTLTSADQRGLYADLRGSSQHHSEESASGLRKSARSGFQPLLGYREPLPVVFASFYPEDTGLFDELRDALEKLRLTDSSLNFEPESSTALGRGFRLGFLGMLHVEIISERLKREFNLNLIVTSPSVEYHVNLAHGNLVIRSASELDPGLQIESIEEPVSYLTIITPVSYLGSIMKLLDTKRSVYEKTDYLSANIVKLTYKVPLAEIITDFYDQLKSVSSGYASMSYETAGYQKSDLVRLDILIAGDLVGPFSRIAPRDQAYRIGRIMVEKLKEVIPSHLFAVSIQAAIGGKIIARETIKAMRKDVTGYLYGGDVTRKMKLLKKQKRGKKKMKESGKVSIPQNVFLEMLKK